MKYSIRPLKNEDEKSVMDILNHYIENSFAAFPEKSLPYQAFSILLQISEGLPSCSITDENDNVMGFGMLKHHNNIPVFSKTAEITYFLKPEMTGKGLGRMVMDWLETEGRIIGIRNILAPISSLNPGSIKFHEKNGFLECGCFREIGIKKGQNFDVIWMQKKIL